MAQRTRRYLIRRVTVVLLTLFVVTLLSFLLMRLSPVDPATAYVKRNSAVVTQEQIDEAVAVFHRYGQVTLNERDAAEAAKNN